MTDSADLRFLLTIQDNGSLVATARALDLTPSAVSQRLQQLEKKLGTRLVDRTARSLRFTQEGALLCERGAELIRQLDALAEDLHTRRGGLVGTLKVNAPLGFGRRYVAPVIADFQQQHPDVDIELALSDAPLVEAADRFDVVVHIGALQVSNLVGHAIAPNARFVCASPAFVKRFGLPETPDALAALRHAAELTGVSQPRPLSCNDGDVFRQWACEGRGVSLRSEWDVADDLRAGRLVRLLPGWKAPDANVIALTHNRAGLPQRTRHFMQALQSPFKPQPPWRA